MRIVPVNSVNLRGLARRQRFMRIQAPCASQQPLSAEHLMNAWNAACKLMRRIEEGCIGIRDLGITGQPFLGKVVLSACFLDLFQQLHRFIRPNRPVTKQAADNRLGDHRSVHPEPIRCQQIVNDVVIVPRIQRNILAAA